MAVITKIKTVITDNNINDNYYQAYNRNNKQQC